jgi:hypothetical protein
MLFAATTKGVSVSHATEFTATTALTFIAIDTLCGMSLLSVLVRVGSVVCWRVSTADRVGCSGNCTDLTRDVDSNHCMATFRTAPVSTSAVWQAHPIHVVCTLNSQAPQTRLSRSLLFQLRVCLPPTCDSHSGHPNKVKRTTTCTSVQSAASTAMRNTSSGAATSTNSMYAALCNESLPPNVLLYNVAAQELVQTLTPHRSAVLATAYMFVPAERLLHGAPILQRATRSWSGEHLINVAASSCSTTATTTTTTSANNNNNSNGTNASHQQVGSKRTLTNTKRSNGKHFLVCASESEVHIYSRDA